MTDALGRPFACLLAKPLAWGLTCEGCESTVMTLSFPFANAR
jgi:hypothetical protein